MLAYVLRFPYIIFPIVINDNQLYIDSKKGGIGFSRLPIPI